MDKLLGAKLLGIKLRWDRFFSSISKCSITYVAYVCSISHVSKFSDPSLYDESRASIDGASLSNSFIVVTNKLDWFQLWLNATPCHIYQVNDLPDSFMAHSWDKGSRKNLWRKSFFNLNWYPVQLTQKSHSMLKLMCCKFRLYFPLQTCC